ncbi:MAG: nucleotidyltransferase substrate binding protein [Deltaproteobacteria bacterium]|nr:nucleotidyltransferase substrate binding protein [Deltaproteobacteria bacterium]
MTDNKPRWIYRFNNFQRAYTLLREAMEEKADHKLNSLEKEGVIQRFEYSIELAWKTLKDYLEYQNVVFSQVTPRVVIKEAFAANIIDGQVWMNALDARNKMSHTYDESKFEEVIEDIQNSYFPAMEELYFKFLKYVQEEGYSE